MEKLTFHIVDVFAEEKYAGNQLAVFRHIGGLSDVDMQQIAREMNYSETTFILADKPRNGGYDVRIFTPEGEVPFAGHPTLGTAFIIQQEILREAVETIHLNLQVGKITVNFNYRENTLDNLWMQQIAPTFGDVLDMESLSQILGLTIQEFDENFPIEEVSTGLPFMIIPLKTLASLKRIKVVRDQYFEFIKGRWAKGILAFCPETYHKDNQLCVRVFVDCFGILEDPATGSGNGCLAGYLVKHRYWGTPHINLRVEQGYEIRRPSLLFLKAEEQQEKIAISVGGKVIKIAKGEFV